MAKKFPQDRKNYKQAEDNVKETVKEKELRIKEHVENLKDGIRVPVPKTPEPIYQHFMTFQGYSRKWEGKGKNKKVRGPVKQEDREPFFGKSLRFDKTEKERVSKAIKLYNENNDEGKKIDPKQDPVPGPGYYKTQEVWKGKDVRMRRPYSANPKVGDKILKSISKGPSISIYNSRGPY